MTDPRTNEPEQPCSPGSRAERVILLAVLLIALGASAIGPYDRLTWWLEIAPVIIGLTLCIGTRSRFPLTALLVRLLFLHALVLILGGYHTYARVPLGFYLQDALDLSRNPYDRIGHFLQGFVPAILAREILLRTSPLQTGRWLFFLVSATCLAFSAFYELAEWLAAILLDADADAFLGTQGDVWDTQWDMALALFGAILAQLLLAPRHDRALQNLGAVAIRRAG